MESETRALLQDAEVAKPRSSLRRDALCFVIGCATAAVFMTFAELPGGATTLSNSMQADAQVKEEAASQMAVDADADVDDKESAAVAAASVVPLSDAHQALDIDIDIDTAAAANSAKARVAVPQTQIGRRALCVKEAGRRAKNLARRLHGAPRCAIE